MGIFKSKRFISFTVAVIMFTVMIYTTPYDPMELAGAITMLAGIYIGMQTYRKSDMNERQ